MEIISIRQCMVLILDGISEIGAHVWNRVKIHSLRVCLKVLREDHLVMNVMLFALCFSFENIFTDLYWEISDFFLIPISLHTICPRSSDPFYIVYLNYIKWLTTYSYFELFISFQLLTWFWFLYFFIRSYFGCKHSTHQY